MSSRRSFLGGLVAAAFAPARAFGAARPAVRPTPHQTEGPFYPSPAMRRNRVGAPPGNDLTRVGEHAAQGLRIAFHGQVTTLDGEPLAGATIEIWQTCHRGRYLHPSDDFGSEIPQDPGFTYWGTTTTDEQGGYGFLTVMPRRYPSGGQREWWRPPHVHFQVTDADGDQRLTTQLYFDDPADPENDWKHRAIQTMDRLIRDIPRVRRGELVVPLTPLPDSTFAAVGVSRPVAADDSLVGPPRVGRFDAVVK